MSWNYRLMAFGEGDNAWLAIHEVYYDEASNPTGYTERPAEVVGDDLDEVKVVLERMTNCLAKPTLTAADFVRPDDETIG